MTTFNFRGLPDCFVRMIRFFVLRYLEIRLLWIYYPKNSWSNAFKPESTIAAITAGLHQIWSYIVASSAGAAVLVSPLGIQPSNFQLARTPFDGQAQMMRTSVITTFEQNQFHHKNTPSPPPPPTVVLVNRKLTFLGKHVWPIVTSWHAMPCIIHWPTFINLSQNLVAFIVSQIFFQHGSWFNWSVRINVQP